ncbi:hypothetical protein J4G37_16245 [Microvirga sp. 3-52]|nr:hypothetical protein [Microvirga sp. 3-52]
MAQPEEGSLKPSLSWHQSSSKSLTPDEIPIHKLGYTHHVAKLDHLEYVLSTISIFRGAGL